MHENLPFKYAFNYFSDAVRCLAIVEGNIKKRLHGAYLAIQMVQPRHLPEELQNDLKWIFAELTVFDPDPDSLSEDLNSKVLATLHRRQCRTLRRVAERIVHIYLRLRNHYLYGTPFG